jgi:flagellar biosynthesis/type III secretory pathway protein FliH
MTRIVRPSGAARLIPKVDHDAMSEARLIIEEARGRAAELVASAKRESDTIRQASRLQGLEEGRTQCATLVEALTRCLDAHDERADALVIDVAVALAGRIIGHLPELRSKGTAGKLREALEHLRRALLVEVVVHPEDVDAIESFFRQRSKGPEEARVTVTADSSIARGGVIVRTDVGVVDGRIETQLAALADALKAKTVT